jgi:hypothetical protein
MLVAGNKMSETMGEVDEKPLIIVLLFECGFVVCG